MIIECQNWGMLIEACEMYLIGILSKNLIADRSLFRLKTSRYFSNQLLIIKSMTVYTEGSSMIVVQKVVETLIRRVFL
jgi:hypothetical protein